MRLPEKPRATLRIPAPVRRAIGFGDAIKNVTQRLGFEPCGGCQKRAAAMNRWIQLSPLDRRER